jgi:hypothetical protein
MRPECTRRSFAQAMMLPNLSLKPTRLAGENAVAPGLPRCLE